MKFFVERPIATAMIFLALFLLGIYSFLHIPVELAPKEEYPRASIETSWPGVPPEIILTQITSPLEEICSAVKGVKKMTSESRVGNSRITLEFNDETNMKFAHLVLNEKIAKASDILPYGVRPMIQPYVPPDFRVESFLSYTISGNSSLQKLREVVKDKIEVGIGVVQGVAGVEVSGGSEPEIRIILDKEKIKTLSIHPYLVSSKIRERTRTQPAGKINRSSQEFLFKVSDPIKSIAELGETVIAYSGDNPIRLRDIAKIVPSYGEIFYKNRRNGQPAVRLTVVKEEGTSTLRVAKKVKKKLEAIKKELPKDLVFKVIYDESEEIQRNLRNIYLLVVIIAVVLFLLIFLVFRSYKPPLLILSSIVFSVLVTFNLIYFLRLSINLLTLGGLALGFGLFVDNSIVIFENIWRLRERGFYPSQAAAQGSKEVILPVLAATLTTMSVFFSFAYFQGRLRIYYLPLAIVISSALAASLFVSFSLIPALSPRMEKKRKVKEKKARNNYKNILRMLIRHPVEIILIIGLIFFGAYKLFLAKVTIGEFFRWHSRESVRVYIGMPPGTDIQRTDRVVKMFEERVLEKNYEKEMNAFISAERAILNITFPPEIEGSFLPFLLKEELIQLATNFAGISISISGFDPQGYHSSLGYGSYYDSRIKFRGYSLKKLKEITSKLEKILKKNPRVREVRTVSSRFGWWKGDYYEYLLKINKKALRKYDIDPLYFYSHFHALLQERVTVPLKAKIGGKEMPVSVKFPEADRMKLKNLQQELLRTKRGQYLRLREISALEERLISGSIDRENQQFQQIIMWQFRSPPRAAQRYKEAVFSKLKLPPGFSATLEEEWGMTEEEQGQIKFAIIFSLVVIFIILASLFESIIHPFFILVAFPLALIGVFVAFVIMDFAFDSSAYIGLILLGGIVVNNSILLVDRINFKKRQGLSLMEAVLEGTGERIRPVFLTTSTTVMGMLPLVLIQVEAGKKQIWSSLALSAVGGLVSSSLFILIVIPILYFYGDSLRYRTSRKIEELRETVHLPFS